MADQWVAKGWQRSHANCEAFSVFNPPPQFGAFYVYIDSAKAYSLLSTWFEREREKTWHWSPVGITNKSFFAPVKGLGFKGLGFALHMPLTW